MHDRRLTAVEVPAGAAVSGDNGVNISQLGSRAILQPTGEQQYCVAKRKISADHKEDFGEIPLRLPN